MSRVSSFCRVLSIFVAIAGSGLVPGEAAAADWPHWRGPNQDGISREAGIFGDEPFALEVAWEQPFGVAYSGISVADGRAITMVADGESDFVVAIDPKSGDELWRYEIGPRFPAVGGSEGGPVSVPVVDGGLVFGLGALGHLFAVRSSDGSEIWSMRIDEALGARAPRFGFTTTPLVADDLLFVQAGGDEGRSLAGLDKKTGKLRWTLGDDGVSYQSPISAELAGRRQIVAVTDSRVLGLTPGSGEILWEREHGLSPDGGGSASAVLLGDDRFFLGGDNDSAAYRLEQTEEGFTVDEIWRTTDLKGSFAVPVLHEDHLYGFNGNFLTCISTKDGKRVWRSRPPGGNGLILVDGHLVIFGPDGEIIVATASPDGYDEKARVPVSDRGSYTYPSFADGTIFARNTRNIAAVTVARGASRAAEPEVEAPGHAFGAFVSRVEQSALPRLLVDSFMNSQERFPIVEDGRWVHFIYRGEAEDVAVTGSMTELRVEEPMERIAGTDLFHASYPIEPGSRWEYRFNVDFENLQPDPLNPRRVPAGGGDRSELITPEWSQPQHILPYEGSEAGRLESFELESEVLGGTRRVQVYLPHDYDTSGRSYPLLILNDGKPWIDLAHLPNSLDHLIGRKVAPFIAVFPEQPRRAMREEFGGKRSADYVRMLADELVPHLDREYRTLREPGARAVVGAGSGATMAIYAALERGDVFGMVGGCSFSVRAPLESALFETIEARGGRAANSRFHVTWSRYDLHRTAWDLDMAGDSRRVAEALKASGYEVAGGEVLDAAGWGGWRAQIADLLVDFFPM